MTKNHMQAIILSRSNYVELKGISQICLAQSNFRVTRVHLKAVNAIYVRQLLLFLFPSMNRVR